VVEARLVKLAPLHTRQGILQRASLEERQRIAAIERAARQGIRLRFDAAGNQFVARQNLQESMFGGELPLTEQNRRYYGRSLTPEFIEQAVRSAELGYMRDLTDLQYETLAIDPHFTSAVGKRVRALASIKPNVIAASGDGIDPSKAKLYADVVRQQLAWIPNWRQQVRRLNWAQCHGRAALEKVWRENPAGSTVKWRIDSLNWIHPRRLSFGPERELRVRDDSFAGGAFERRGLELRQIPFKFISFTPQQFNDYPEREGFGPRGMYFSFFKRFSWRERLILLEVFGKPWRIVYADDAQVQVDTLDDAAVSADALGANATGVMPPGVKLQLETPDHNSGTIHKEVAAECNDEISKLVSGTTRTNDAKPGALGSAGDEVGQDEQSSVYAADGWDISDLLTEQLGADIIVLNFGAEALDHAPRIELKYEVTPTRGQEIERTAKVFGLGIPLKRSEVYERVGFAEPQPEDLVVQQAPQPAGGFGSPGGGGGGGFGQQSGAGGASPLGDDGQGLPDQDTFTDRDPLQLVRAAHVLKLLTTIGGR
jgi:phage gp29-like protein